MFSLRFLAVRQVRPRAREEGPPFRKMTCSVRTPGPRNSDFVEIRGGHQRQPAVDEQKKDEHEGSSQDPMRPATRSSPPLWPGEVELQDKEGQDTVQIALVCEMEETTTQPRERFCHSVATIDVVDFRRRPDVKFTFWLPLRPVTASSPVGGQEAKVNGSGSNSDAENNSSGDEKIVDEDDDMGGDHDLGAIKVSVTYFSDDCVDQGYWYALFCGLVPLPLILLWASDDNKSSSSSSSSSSTICNSKNPDNNAITLSTPARDTYKSRNTKEEPERSGEVVPVTMDKRRPTSAAAAAQPLQMGIEVL